MTTSDDFDAKYNWFVDKSGVQRKQYQYDGIRWCIRLETHSDPSLPIRGGFVADEMGLGKTVLMIATCLIHFVPSTLIVVPNILIHQWSAEIFRMTGHTPLVYYGAKRNSITSEQLATAPIVITSYNVIALKRNERLSPLFLIRWNRIIFDEAHHLRNINSRWHGSRQLKSDIRWFVSGTPIQNRKVDFFNLCSALFLPYSYYTNLDNLPHLVRHFVLKRTKEEVGLDLPCLMREDQLVPWGNGLEENLATHLHVAAQPGSKNRMRLLMYARHMCILPRLLRRDMLDKLVEARLMPSFDEAALLGTSKVDSVLALILARRGNGNGKLVFCHYRQEIDIILRRLKEVGIVCCSFDGRLAQKRRYGELNHGYEVIVLQIQTGCEGLNLQDDFNEIYFVSPDWNPFVEDQAVARCHRFGQVKNCFVFRFQMSPIDRKSIRMSSSSRLLTVDNYVDSMQLAKRKIAEDILECEMRFKKPK
jgi:SNF2 family DNA or RNA helicase